MHSTRQRSKARPDPVSCQSCRSKKLKCNRVRPCSNCAARGISCHFLVPPQKTPETTTTEYSSAELISRIERLEATVFQSFSLGTTHPQHAPDDSRHAGQTLFTPASEPVVGPDVHQTRDKDSDFLENIGTREDSLLSPLSHGLVFRIDKAREIHRAHASPQDTIASYPLGNIIITFPTYREAALLFQNFESNIDQMCRILHIPTTKSLIKTTYMKLGQGEAVPLGQAGLLLSIFALSGFFYRCSENSEIATSEQEAVHISKVIGKAALDVLDYSRRNTSGTLEDVQAYIFMSLVSFHLDGFSARGRLLSATAAAIARDLRLHRLDAADERPAKEETSVRDLIDREVRRRVFWHITAEDWLQSTISGPQAGMYFIHPNHIDVRLPKYYFDDEILLSEETESADGPRPSGTAFLLERIRLAHLCREIVDTVPSETSKALQMPYENIIALDKKLQDFLLSLPFFFRTDPASRETSRKFETVYPYIPHMRYAITNAAHSRRCKLHQRFLLRQSHDPRYSYSRRACLESAFAVINGYEDPTEFDSPAYTTARMGLAMHYMHLALAVMVMDLCFNRPGADGTEVKTKLREAFQKFDDDRHVSPLPRRFLSSLREVLQKHGVYLTNQPTVSGADGTIHGVTDGINSTSSNLLQEVPMQSAVGSDIPYAEAGGEGSFEEFWQSAIESEMNLDSTTWDTLFSALDTRPI
ncbi:uncharacterized protein F4812DRAFT_453515 [Daldinia caldariorum]|uniref:uncharacterized protein n=1 Tax=Daldinia caldariorum TaxID=326644 RepID=UPI0020073177|nr:uncharacterized protein F4812DRAFT_453515 [Daldinia caldariorum]KAI1463571.1 hypothetical protein F4812DRAFT_453515 [Daldinia caldariorum]